MLLCDCSMLVCVSAYCGLLHYCSMLLACYCSVLVRYPIQFKVAPLQFLHQVLGYSRLVLHCRGVQIPVIGSDLCLATLQSNPKILLSLEYRDAGTLDC